MKIETFRQKLAELLEGNNNPLIQKETMRLAESGGVNLEEYEEDDFGIVKTVLLKHF